MQDAERDQIQSLIQLVIDEDLAELTVHSEGEKFRIRRGDDSRRECLTRNFLRGESAPRLASPALASQATDKALPETNPNLVRIISPMVGIFYRSPSPGTEPFVEVGGLVEEGQTIGLVEAMKVFNEITAEVNGRVIAVPAATEQLVQHGDTLVIIERADG
ncbi:MAG: acetyl-CoA carboxylase, biotin carboxyl carrier protein [Armatimonadetes bacterium CG2_30_59_28]|nr:acetyl-CoA carboxylase biotin carboxyl carrier protein [Armatimonadota bacterium]OIO91723.1 MAG: acetyl-CoA carboxylase, biotin carboxyl carrier protein [Armatimonadetes bacterium CG2_30_59_28]PIU60329.1 MAG: acetyl-CoA carboxylase, biotin carboxyl carrier protein [Armatimonadetes bacterium CG07_land_8_20_14_0_80_59_28]PIX39443.1 MAG: acetyl-CoA carboxylase, biotin carboxyl carrier protein [Armatimonadetes bacterium CG_4_8_14_3_um_filter_58_9]PIY44114.1 MAG: acetyl-CoA carboxylase, biotin ca